MKDNFDSLTLTLQNLTKTHFFSPRPILRDVWEHIWAKLGGTLGDSTITHCGFLQLSLREQASIGLKWHAAS